MIRRYKDNDLPAILEIWDKASAIAHPFLDKAFVRRERTNIIDVYLPNAETWVFEKDETVAGFLSLVGNEIGGLFVTPDQQRAGIGRALVDHATTLRDTLDVEVFQKNRIGRRFYDRYGFRFLREYLHKETGETMLRLEWVK